MKRFALIVASTFLLAGSSLKAGELDAEFGGKVAKVTPAPATPALIAASSELDSESPDQACCWRKRFYGYRHCGFGYGLGYYGGFGYGGFGGGYGGISYASYGGFGGYGGGMGYGGFGW
jgi:hypothetical protein